MSSRRDWWTPERREWARQRTKAFKPSRFSTGPRTPAGKARSRLNGLRHGLRSRNPHILILGTLAALESAAAEGYRGLSEDEKEAIKARCPQLLAIGERVTNDSAS